MPQSRIFACLPRPVAIHLLEVKIKLFRRGYSRFHFFNLGSRRHWANGRAWALLISRTW